MTSTMDLWTWDHTLAAGRQGWCIAGVRNDDHAPWEIQRLDSAEEVSKDWGIEVPQLASDDHAVQVLKESYARGEPHAVLAYQLLRDNSPQEFAHWRMEAWTC